MSGVDVARPVCAVEGCGRPRRKREWCATHYQQWRTTGTAEPFHHKWATERVCVVCGVDVPVGTGRRKHCSGRCAALDSLHQGNRPISGACAQCGATLDFLELTKAGHFRRVDTKMCRRCKQDVGKYGMSAPELAIRDGATCRLCDGAIDMDAVHPDYFRASVDHVIPRANGGSDAPENLQLTHLWCNQVKSDRAGFALLLDRKLV